MDDTTKIPGRPGRTASSAGRRWARGAQLAFTDQPVDGRDEWWRYAVTLGGAVAAGVLAAVLASSPAFASLLEPVRRWDALLAGLLRVLVLFATVLAVFLVLHRVLHRRPVWSLVSAAPRWRAGRAVGSFLIVLPCTAAVLLFLPGSTTTRSTPVVLGLALLIVLVQISAEEVVFRGYLLPRLVRWTRLRWAILLSAALFALVHLANGTGLALVTPTVFGIFAAWWATRDDGLWVPLGVHLGINASNLFVVPDGTAPAAPPPGLLAVLLIAAPLVLATIFMLVTVVFFPRSGPVGAG